MAKSPAFADIVAAASKKYNTRVGALDSVVDDIDVASSGNIAIDHIFGVGGFPLGRICELFGNPSSGKSSMAIQTAAWVQNEIRTGNPLFEGKVVLYCDFEHALDPEYVRVLGLDVEDSETFLLMQPDNFEDGANLAYQLIKTGKVAIVIFDSVAAMVPQAIGAKEVGEATMAVRARLMSAFLQKLVSLVDETKTLALFLNHLLDDMSPGGRPGFKKTTTPGGKALKYYSSIRVEFTQIKQVKGKQFNALTNEEEDITDAVEVRVKVVKNKLGPPFRQAVVLVRFGKGFDEAHTARQILIGHKKIVAATGKYYYFHNLPELVTEDMPRAKTGTQRPFIQGDRAFYQWCDEHPEWRLKLIETARKTLLEQKSPERIAPLTDEDDTDDVLHYQESPDTVNLVTNPDNEGETL